MRTHKLIVFFYLIICIGIQSAYSQQLRNPFDFPILLSGNFGELRSNHFHSGIDFKTQGVEGKPIHAVEDGYISRISVSPWGYGNALYIIHPNGITTVYGHLQRYTDSLASYIKDKQYEQENFSVNLTFSPDQFPVKKGDTIAYSGNTGSSGGPHLHFEIRNTDTEEPMDPIEYYKNRITDTKSPKIQGVMIYPIEGKGVVNGKAHKQELKLITAKNGKQSISGKIEAWGEIGLGVKAYDYMDGTSNIYGVKEITLIVDSLIIYQSKLEQYAFNETRMLNTFTDYEAWKEHRSFFMKSFTDPGNRLRFIQTENRGIITINEERTYHLIYKLADAFGNTTQLSLWIEGKIQDIPQPDSINTEHFRWYSDNRFGAKGIRLSIPKNNLYQDLFLKYTVREDSTAFAGTHTLHNKPVALHQTAQLSLRIQNDTLENKQQYGIVRVNKGRRNWIGGSYRNGWIDTDIRELGSYTINIDTVPPTITPVQPEQWINKKRISFRISDNLSGVQTYRGEIDGQYVLFEMDGKRALISYTFDSERLERGAHLLELTVRDACGNQTVYTKHFTW